MIISVSHTHLTYLRRTGWTPFLEIYIDKCQTKRFAVLGVLKGLAFKSHDWKSKSIKSQTLRGSSSSQKETKTWVCPPPPKKKKGRFPQLDLIALAAVWVGWCLSMPFFFGGGIYADILIEASITKIHPSTNTVLWTGHAVGFWKYTKKLSSKVRKSQLRVHGEWWTPKQKRTPTT